MRIRVKSGDVNINLPFPTGMVFNRGTVWLANTVGRHYAGEAMEGIPPEALSAIFAEFRRIKKKHGSWNLVEVESSNGDLVTVTL